MDLQKIIETFGYLGIFFIIFSESGLLFGIVFPGDSLLFTAGFLASQNLLSIWILLPLCFVAAVTGDSMGYAFGHRVGRKFFKYEKNFFFRPEVIERAKEFYERHGGKTIILARFIPGVRTLAPIMAGIGGMHYASFLTYNVLGALFWAVGITMLGYFLGSVIPGVERYLTLVIGGVIVLSLLPPVIEVLKTSERRQKIKQALQRVWYKAIKR